MYARFVGRTGGLKLEGPGVVVKPTAEWRITGAPEERLKSSPLETAWQRIVAWFLLICGITYAFLVARRPGPPEAYFVDNLRTLALIALAQASLFYLYRRESNWIDIGLGLKRLKTKVPTESACSVSVSIRQLGAVTGRDEGYMWIQGGTLYFKGLQSVFRLNSEDVPPLESWPRRAHPDPASLRPPHGMPVVGGRHDMSLDIRFIDPYEDYGSRRRSSEFIDSLMAWLREKPQGELESLLPPDAVHPMLQQPGTAQYEGIVAGSVLTGINLALLSTARRDIDGRTIAALGEAFLVAATLVLAYLAVRLTMDQYRDFVARRRLFLEHEIA